MYYVFSNDFELDLILDEFRYQDLPRAFMKTKIKKKRCLKKGQISASKMYKRICEVVLSDLDVESQNAIKTKAIKLFTESWDIEALAIIEQNPQVYGVLTAEAKSVLKEYQLYKKLAQNAVLSMIFEERKEKNIPIGYDGKCIKVRYVDGETSFVRNGIEYIV